MSRHHRLVDHRVDRDPVAVHQPRQGRLLQCREDRHHAVHLLLGHVHHQTNLAFRRHGAAQHERDVLDLAALPVILPSGFVGDQPRGALHDRVHDAQVVGAQRAAGLGNLHDGVREARRFHFRGAPGELHVRLHAVPLQVVDREVDRLGSDVLALQIARALDRRILRNRQHPAHRTAAHLREHQLGDFHHLRAVLDDPVVPGQPGVHDAILDVPSHLLGAYQDTLDLRIVDVGVIGARPEGDPVTRLTKQFGGGVLQAAGRDAELQHRRAHLPYTCRGSNTRSATTCSSPSATCRKKQLR